MEHRSHPLRDWLAGQILLPILFFLLLSSDGWGMKPLGWWVSLVAIVAVYVWSVWPFMAISLAQSAEARRRPRSPIVLPDGQGNARRRYPRIKAFTAVFVPLVMCMGVSSYLTYRTIGNAPSRVVEQGVQATRPTNAPTAASEIAQLKQDLQAAISEAANLKEQLEKEQQAHRNDNEEHYEDLIKQEEKRLRAIQNNKPLEYRQTAEIEYGYALREAEREPGHLREWYAIAAARRLLEQRSNKVVGSQEAFDDWLLGWNQEVLAITHLSRLYAGSSPGLDDLVPAEVPPSWKVKQFQSFNSEHNAALNTIAYQMKTMDYKLEAWRLMEMEQAKAR